MEIFITLIIWAAVIQGLLLGVIFITSRKYQSFANKLLGSFLIAFVFEALTDLLPFSAIGNYSISGYFTLPEVKLLLPVLFLHFVLEKVGRSSFYKTFLKIHYVFGFSIIGLTFINFLLFVFSGNSLLGLFGWLPLEHFYMGHQYYAFILTHKQRIFTINYWGTVPFPHTPYALDFKKFYRFQSVGGMGERHCPPL